jgi:hypothetical protein
VVIGRFFVPNSSVAPLAKLLDCFGHCEVSGVLLVQLFALIVAPVFGADVALDQIATERGAAAGFAQGRLLAGAQADMLPTVLADQSAVVVEEVRGGVAVAADDEPEPAVADSVELRVQAAFRAPNAVG